MPRNSLLTVNILINCDIFSVVNKDLSFMAKDLASEHVQGSL